jgi:5'-deoxynucleotidase
MKTKFNRHYRTLGYVPRWSIMRLNRSQSVLEHTALVAMYALDIMEAIKYQGDWLEVVDLALKHDLPEVESGDLPSPVKRSISTPGKMQEYEDDIMKRRFGSPTEYTEDAHDIVKVADLLEAVLKLAEEYSTGNRSVFGVLCGLTAYLNDAVSKLAGAQFLWDDIHRAIDDELFGQDGIRTPREDESSFFWQEALKREKDSYSD